jgi:Fe-S protein assembly chaperone HscA
MSTFQIDFGESRKSKIVGIDLGTTNSLVAYMDLTGPKVVEDSEGRKIVPSIVSLAANDRLVAGEVAREALFTHPERTVYSVKRLMGRGRADVADELKLFPFHISSESDAVIRLELGDRTFTPPEISAAVLKQLKDNAELALGEPVSEAVVTVPAYFNDAQRQATKDAGRIAGLNVLRLVNEPTAASLAYGLDKRKNGIIAVYDFGGGTFDISILRLQNGIFEVLATNGDTHLGGDDIDNLLLSIALEDVQSEWGQDLTVDAEGVQRLRHAVIKAKEELSFVPESKIELNYAGKQYARALDRALFERLITPVIERTLEPCKACLADAHLTAAQIDEVVMVGGSTRIPLVRAAVERLFKAKPHTELNPDEVVALGAAVQAGILSGEVEDQLLLDVTPLSLGIETMGGVVSKLIHRNSTIPASASETFTTAVDGQSNVLIHVLQGERELVKDNRSLARFDLKNIAPTPAGFARIEVRFLIDANGILNVTARDARTGVEQTVEVTPSHGLSREEVEAKILDSEVNAESDMRERQVREARVEADNVLAALAKAQKNDAWSALSADERNEIETAKRDLETTYHGSDHHAILNRLETLNQVTQKLAENMMNTAVRGALKGTKVE